MNLRSMLLVAFALGATAAIIATLRSEAPVPRPGLDRTPSGPPERLGRAGTVPDGLPEGPATVDTDLIVPGGPPPDGIPPIDEPRFLDPSQVEGLAPREPVISLEVGGGSRAYPVRILMWHEIVNDEIAGQPVTVTYCPLCNTAVAFRRPVIDGQLLDFGTSGRLYHSNLVMYDRQTGTYWSQATLEAIVGPLAGRRLELMPAQLVSWRDWRARHPDGRVLSEDTGFERSYGQNPYQGYDSPNNDRPFAFRGDPDPRLPATARVLGVTASGRSMAFPYEQLRRTAVGGHAVGKARLGSQDVVVFWKEGTASVLDQPRIAASRDVGSATAFVPRSGDVVLHLDARAGGFVDRETGSRWDILGHAISGSLRGSRLEPLPAVDHFWFSWAAFFPDTAIYRSS